MGVQRPQYHQLTSLRMAAKRCLIQRGAIILLSALALGGCAAAGGGGTTTHFAINTITIPDAITARSYTAYVATSSSVTPDLVTSCALTGSIPTGMTTAPGTVAGAASYCVLTMASAPVAGEYSFTLKASDSSTPAKTASQPYSLTVHPEFTYTTTSLAQGVQGRAYGVSPLAQTETTTMGSTISGITVGSGQLTACSVSATPANPGLTAAVDPTGTKCMLSSNTLTPAGSYAVTVSATETSILDPVSSGVAVPGTPGVNNTLTLVVNPEITFSLNFDSASGGSVGIVPDAVQGRTYGAPARSSLVLTAQGGLMASQGLIISGSGALPLPVDCVVSPAASPALTPGTPPETPSGTAVVSATNITVSCAGGAVTSAPGATVFATSVKDLGNAATPPNTIAADLFGHTSHTLTLDAPLALTVDAVSAPVNPAPVGVVGRSYGNTAAGFKDLAFDGNGGLRPYIFGQPSSVASPAANGVPAGVICAPAGTALACTSGASPISASAGNYPFSITLNDTGNATTPSALTVGTQPTPIPGSITVAPVLNIAVTQTSNTTPASHLLDGVANRSYGVINGGAGAPTYSALGGLSTSGNYLWCIVSGSTLPPGMSGISTTCGPTTSTSASSVALAANSIGGSGGTYSFTVQVDDGGNASVPGTSSASSTANTVGPTSLVIRPQIAINLNSATPPEAVTGRTYGSPTRTDLIYTVPSGQGLSPITLTGSGFPAPIACPTTSGTQQLNCNSGNAAITGATSAGTVIASDTPNTATPAATTTTDPNSRRTSDTVNVRAALALTPPSGSLATAVVGRSWGEGNSCAPGGNSACAAAVYTIANGLGGYSPGPVTVGPLSCTFTSTGTFAGNYSCATSSESSLPSSATLSLTVSDIANSATPSGTVTDSSKSLPIQAEMTVTPPASTPTAVHGRAYGTGTGCSGGACQPLQYSVTNGLGNYTLTGSSLITPSDVFTCTLTSPTFSCSKTAIAGAGGTNPTLTFTGAETGNASTPSKGVTDTSKALSTNAEMVLTPPGVIPVAVTGRSYGVGSTCGASGTSACAPLSYSITNGLGNYQTLGTMTTTAGTFSCLLSGTTYQCSSADITGAGSPALTVSVSEPGNSSTPGNSLSDNSKTLSINPEMTFTAMPTNPFADAVAARTYGLGSTCGVTGSSACLPLTYTIQSGSGLGGYSYVLSPSIGFNCTSGNSTSNCTSAALAGGANTYASVHVAVTDTADASVPSNTVASTNGSLTVHSELSFTATPTSPLADAVTSRTYGQGSICGALGTAACTPLTYSITNNSGLGGYAFALVVNSGNGGFACTGGGTSSNCSSALVTQSAGSYTSVHAAVSDTPNASTPSNNIASSNGSLTVHSELSLTPAGGSLPAGVQGRTYGQGNTCGASGSSACTTISYAISNGLGNYVSPATMTTTAGTFSCPLSASTYQCSSANITAAGSSALSLTASEKGNGATPGNSKTNNSETLTINPEMNFTATPTSPFGTAVNGRAYGQGSNCGAFGNSPCAPLTYTIQSGSGLGGYSFSLDVDGGNGGFVCTSGGSSSNCTSGSVTEASGTYNAVHTSVTDTANAATPSNTVISSNGTLTVNAGLALNSPASPYPDGENNVSYGSAGSGCSPNSACLPLSYTVPFVNPIVDGLPPYAFSTSGFPTNLNCFQSNAGAPAPTGTILTCMATAGISVPGPFPEESFPVVQVKDTANASVPSATAYNTAASLKVQQQLSILNAVLPNGLVGFQYYPSGSGVTIKSQGGIESVSWVGPGDGSVGACAAPAAATLPGQTAMTFNDTTQLFSTGGSSFASADVSASDGSYTFQVCVTDTGNAATPRTAALPNPGAPAPLVANHFVFDVLNPYTYTPETSTDAVDVINTATSTVVGTGISLHIAPTTHPNGVAVSPDGTRAYVTLSNNKFAVIDTIVNEQITGSPFSMPVGSTCTSLAGVAVTNDGRAYFACPTSSGTGGVVDVVNTTNNTTLVAELATGNEPSGVAISPSVDATTGKTSQVYVGLFDANRLAVISNSLIPAVSSTITLNSLNAQPLGLAAVLNPGGHVYVYIAKQVAGSGNPGIEIVDSTASSLVNDFAFSLATRVPVGVAATPAGSEVYVTLNDSTLDTSYVMVIDNTATPALRSVTPYGLPDPTIVPPPANIGAAGVAIPPLPGASPDFLIFVAQSLYGNVAVLLDNASPSTNKPLVQPAVSLNGATPAPQGIANIPLPSVIPKLP